ncbi:MAG: GNAT family N-acetyltransferase [Candidatus Aminicenantales bacterium]
MQIVSLSPEHEHVYCVCLEDWSDEVKEGGDHKAKWLAKMAAKGLRVKLALDEKGQVGGMIQYVPIEESFVEGQGLSFIHCIWVHGHKQGRGNFQKKGMGTALLEAAEADARGLGAKGMAAWGMALPVFMRASWFRKHGYKKADALGLQILLWKPFTKEAVPPRWIRDKKKPGPVAGRVTVTALVNGWCPGMNTAFERAKRAAAEFGDKVVFRAIDTFDHEVLREWGESDAIFVDGKGVRMGPPPSYDKIRKTIARRVKKLG